jgi:hypothetical protein
MYLENMFFHILGFLFLAPCAPTRKKGNFRSETEMEGISLSGIFSIAKYSEAGVGCYGKFRLNLAALGEGTPGGICRSPGQRRERGTAGGQRKDLGISGKDGRCPLSRPLSH